jgi:hypothetical protein
MSKGRFVMAVELVVLVMVLLALGSLIPYPHGIVPR